MFEKCGLRDIFYAIWKFKYFIIGVTVVFLLAGLMMSGGKNDSADVVSSAEGKWIASACYLVSVPEDAEIGGSDGDSVRDKEISMAYTYSNILSADYSAEMIYNRLLEKYTKQEIIDGFRLGVSEDTLTFFDFQNAYTVSVLESSSIVNFFVTAENEEMAQALLDECRVEFEKIPSVVDHSSIQYLNGVTSVKYEKTGEDLFAESSGSRTVLIFVIIGVFLSLLIVTAVAVFRPTINRKSDFSFYDVPVIGELSAVKEKAGDTYEK